MFKILNVKCKKVEKLNVYQNCILLDGLCIKCIKEKKGEKKEKKNKYKRVKSTEKINCDKKV